MLNIRSFEGAFMEKVSDTWSLALQEIRVHVVTVTRVFVIVG
jgi:hypothetical protein